MYFSSAILNEMNTFILLDTWHEVPLLMQIMHRLHFDHQCHTYYYFCLLLDIKTMYITRFQTHKHVNRNYNLRESHINCIYERTLRPCNLLVEEYVPH